MIGKLVELSASAKKLKCCRHLVGHVGLIVDMHHELRADMSQYQKYWIDWVGIDRDDAYPLSSSGRPRLSNGTWNRRDLKIIK